ncbi:MAG: hypothetical protein WCT53_01535 [Candidatus Gracilibacteria bacterium]
MFKRITAMGLSLALFAVLAVPAFAQNDNNRENHGDKAVANQVISAEVGACVGTALETRDASIITAFTTYSTNVKAALEARKVALKQAWTKTTQQEVKQATKDAWAAYKKAFKQERKNLKIAKKAAWQTFNGGKTLCKLSGNVKIDNESAGTDSQL